MFKMTFCYLKPRRANTHIGKIFFSGAKVGWIKTPNADQTPQPPKMKIKGGCK